MMNKKKLYESWLEKKSQVEISESFPDKVMNRIHQYKQLLRWFDIQRLIDIISANTIMKSGLVVMGAIIGFIRIMYMIMMFLGKGVLNG
jgi:hypothetical protein